MLTTAAISTSHTAAVVVVIQRDQRVVTIADHSPEP
ncbi:hypothetical protein F4561_003348 [Lipingzhangella halophila]|uniref:Uncharacterized protein n=1 Tax=Lipingzhangella halophila TaxID=1783352 RepID=A0A7W7RJ44_9ACTN|nr:hypothetical protein [Lipingzhangella halophila]